MNNSLYSRYFYSEEVNQLLSDQNFIGMMLCVEGTLALAQSEIGIIPKESAAVIAQICKEPIIDIEKISQEIALSGNAAIPFVKQLTQVVKKQDESASKSVHLGATSQDIIDTATVLQIKDFLFWLEKKIEQLVLILVDLTKKHRQTLMIGRTLYQQAKPITFGLKTAGWLESMERSKLRIKAIKNEVLVIQLAGAVGSGNHWISKEVQQSFAQQLGLKTANSWHTHRDNFAMFGSVLGVFAGSLGKIAKDITLLMQTEIGEVREGSKEGKGGSSTMPHKRNPVTGNAIIANATRIPHLVATLLATMPQEQERSPGLWHSEWEVLTDIMKLTAGTAERTIELLETLEVDEGQMLKNLELTSGLIYAETVSLALASKIGKSEAHLLIEKACKTAIKENKHLKEVLTDLKIDFSKKELNELFKPENSIGLSLEIIEEILGER